MLFYQLDSTTNQSLTALKKTKHEQGVQAPDSRIHCEATDMKIVWY